MKFNDKTKEIWNHDDLIPHLVHGCLTAAHIDSHKVIERDDTAFQLQAHDRVFVNWRGVDRWFYARVTCITSDESGRRYSVKYDDADVESNIPRDRMVFIDRPPIETISQTVNTTAIVVDKDEDIIAILGAGELKREDVVDVEAGEREDHTGL